MFRFHAISIALILFMFAMCLPAQAYSTAAGDRAREIAGWDMVGQRTVRLSDYAGQWVFVEFWASWCGPCVRELPNMIVQTKPYVDAGRLNVITVTIDKPESLGDMRKLIKKHRMPYPVIYDYDEAIGKDGFHGSITAKDWDIHGVPDSFLINPQGVIVASEIRGEKLAETLDFYLGADHPLTGLRGYLHVNEDRSVSIIAEVLNVGMEDVEVWLHTYEIKVFWDGEKECYESKIRYANDPTDHAVVSFVGSHEAIHEFVLPADDELHFVTYYLKAAVPGTDGITGSFHPGILMSYSGEQVTLIDLERIDDELIVYGPTVEYYGRR